MIPVRCIASYVVACETGVAELSPDIPGAAFVFRVDFYAYATLTHYGQGE